MNTRHFLTLLSIYFIMSQQNIFAQFSIRGTVTDQTTQETIAGANAILTGTFRGTTSDNQGNFNIENLREGNYQLRISFVGYETHKEEITLKDNVFFEIKLQPLELQQDAVIVSATRAGQYTPTTYSTLNKDGIEKLNLGQDLPFVLQQEPSVVVTSDAGAGVGYTGIRIRGSDATRVNVTINGIPLNDAESHGTFLVDLPDFASSVNTIQMQRGVGTSTNGAGAFGASINLQTSVLHPDPYGQINLSYGSFNTFKRNLTFGSGLINDKFSIDGRLSQITSDGFIDRASSDLKSFFVSAAYYDAKNIVRANIFQGKEVTYQAWYGIPEARLRGDEAGMQTYIAQNYLSETQAGHLLQSGNRTFNWYTYDNQVDDYQQNHYQLHYSRALSNNLNLTGSLHYTKGKGYYEEYKEGEDLSDYKMINDGRFYQLDENGDTVLIEQSDLIRRKWLDNDFYGMVLSLNKSGKKYNSVLGGAWNNYIGDHFGEVIWAAFSPGNAIRHRYYDNTGDKTDFNVFWKTDYLLFNKLLTFVDLQYRQLDYQIEGIDEDRGAVELDKKYRFFNPKIGLTYKLSPQQQIYASFAIAHREPTRSNLIDNNPIPQPEQLQNFEAGYRFRKQKTALSANYYLMNYKNQLVLTGAVNDVGNPIQQNVATSYRTGIELSGQAPILKKLQWEANTSFSINKIDEYVQNAAVFFRPDLLRLYRRFQHCLERYRHRFFAQYRFGFYSNLYTFQKPKPCFIKQIYRTTIYRQYLEP